MTTRTGFAGERRSPASERGVVLFVALIVLVVMTLAGITLLRQLTGGVSIAGNIAFKENATSVADRGTERAIDWIVSLPNAGVLANDDFANGYHSSWNAATVDPTQFPWQSGQSYVIPGNPDANSGNTAEYILERLCSLPNTAANDPTQVCSDAVVSGTGFNRNGASYGATPPAPPITPYFRVTTRVTGPRSTVTYTQVVLGQ